MCFLVPRLPTCSGGRAGLLTRPPKGKGVDGSYLPRWVRRVRCGRDVGLGRYGRSCTPVSPVVIDHASGNSYQLLSNADWTDSQAR